MHSDFTRYQTLVSPEVEARFGIQTRLWNCKISKLINFVLSLELINSLEKVSDVLLKIDNLSPFSGHDMVQTDGEGVGDVHRISLKKNTILEDSYGYWGVGGKAPKKFENHRVGVKWTMHFLHMQCLDEARNIIVVTVASHTK